MDKSYSYKGWNISYPSEGDTLLQDAGGIRSILDKYGFGFVVFDGSTFAVNALDTPMKTPANYAPSASPGAVAAGHQVYVGERPTFANAAALGVTYDASRLGVPDGQVSVGLSKYNSTWQPLLPNLLSLSQLSFYRTALDKRLQIEVGIMDNTNRFVGANVGGNFASTFGPAASIHVLLGMAFIAAPGANVQYNMTDDVYDKVGIQRSDPVNGPTGNPIFDASKENPTGLTFTKPDDGVFVVNEVGYRREASTGDPETWLRAGGMYNDSRFRDYSKVVSDPTGTVKGNAGVYVLGDRQLLQTASGSPFTAYRGIYVGGTFEYAPPRETPISQYYEARLYSIGPFDSRPTDLVSFVYNHQVFSSYLADSLNPVAVAAAGFGVAVPMARHASNSYTVSYLAHLLPGLYLTVGLGYTDHPSTTYFQSEGSALDALTGLTTIF